VSTVPGTKPKVKPEVPSYPRVLVPLKTRTSDKGAISKTWLKGWEIGIDKRDLDQSTRRLWGLELALTSEKARILWVKFK
jgi:hypothetical protein